MIHINFSFLQIYRNWIYGNTLCQLVNFGQGVVIAASILTLVVISGERLVMSVHDLQYVCIANIIFVNIKHNIFDLNIYIYIYIYIYITHIM